MLLVVANVRGGDEDLKLAVRVGVERAKLLEHPQEDGQASQELVLVELQASLAGADSRDGNVEEAVADGLDKVLLLPVLLVHSPLQKTRNQAIYHL